MKITSSAFNNKKSIPPKYSCDGENINPNLMIKEVPEGTKSLALVVDDPDAASGNFTHWVMWNIPPDVSMIDENAMPQGSVAGTNSFGTNQYGGPCPLGGTHRYYFKVFALDTDLDLSSSARMQDLQEAIEGHVLEQAELVGTYKRES